MWSLRFLLTHRVGSGKFDFDSDETAAELYVPRCLASGFGENDYKGICQNDRQRISKAEYL
jgi:hypothetical protein